MLNGRLRSGDSDAETHELKTLTSLAIGVLVVVGLYVAREVLIPVALAILLAFALAPLVQLIRRSGLGQAPAVIITFALTFGVLTGLGTVIGSQISGLIPNIAGYTATLGAKVENIQEIFKRQITNISETINDVSRGPSVPRPAPVSEDAAKPRLLEAATGNPTPLEIAERVLLPLTTVLITTAIVFLIAIFMMLHQSDLRDRVIRLCGARDLNRTTRALEEAGERLGRFLLTQLGLNFVFGVIIAVGLWFIGVPNPLLWGALGMLFRFVPYIGSFLAALLPALLAAAVDPGWSMALYTIAFFIITETVMGHFVDPFVYGRSTGLAPISVVIAAIFWTWMWGPIGLLLAVPLTVCLVVIGRHVPQLEFLDVLMGDRPAFTSIESFYQRLLADDADEALESAEALLKECSLSTYYDNIAVPGLRLAAQDVQIGALSGVGLARIEHGMARLKEELDDFSDESHAGEVPLTEETSGVELPIAELTDKLPATASERPVGVIPPAWADQPSSILCIAGSGPLDGSVVDMLVQLLGKNGLGARGVAFAMAGRETIRELDFSDVKMVCICCLDLGSGPAQVRYLVRRVRGLLPKAPIAAGLWKAEDQMLDDRMKTAIKADRYARTMREYVNICLQEALSAPVEVPAAAE